MLHGTGQMLHGTGHTALAHLDEMVNRLGLLPAQPSLQLISSWWSLRPSVRVRTARSCIASWRAS